HLHRRSGRRLVRRRAQPAVRACRGGRNRAADRRPGSRRFRLRPRRPGRDHAVHRGRRMAGHDRIRDGPARQRPGPDHRRRGSGGWLAVTPEGAWGTIITDENGPDGVAVAGQLYWTSGGFGGASTGTVSEANLDGSSRHIIVT